MLDRFWIWVTNTIYGVSLHVNELKKKEPGTKVLAYGASKARKLDADKDVRRSIGWAAARRCALILTEEKLVCGSWHISIDDIEKAELLLVRGTLSKGFVIKVSTQNDHYQFGLQYDPRWEEQQVLKFQNEEEFGEYQPIKSNWFTTLIRIALLLYIFWFIYRVIFS